MSRKRGLKGGADSQVCWSFHLHIKCYLVSSRAPAVGRGSQGSAAAAPELRWGRGAADRAWLFLRQLALNNRLPFPGRGRRVRVS